MNKIKLLNNIKIFKEYIKYILPIFSILIFVLGIYINNFNLMFISTVIVLLNNIIYSFENIKMRIVFFIFNITIFTFLMSRPFIGLVGRINWWERFSTQSEFFAISTILITLISIFAGAILCEKCINNNGKKGETTEQKENIIKYNNIRFISIIMFFFCISFTFIIEIDKYVYMWGKDYVEYYLSYSDKFPAIINIFSGMSVPFLCIFLATFPKKKVTYIPLILYNLSNVFVFLIGQRTMFVLSILFTVTYYIIRDYFEDKDKWIGKLEKTGLLILIPVSIIALSVYNYTRTDESIPNKNPINIFVDFFYSQGVTYDVLNIAYSKIPKIQANNKNYTFGGFVDYIKYNTLSKKVFGIEGLGIGNSAKKALNGNSLSHILSYYARPDYLKGHGWGSSYILETYTDYGYIGITVYSIIIGMFLIAVSKLLKKNLFIAISTLICLTSIYISPRAEATGFIKFIITPHFWSALLICAVFNMSMSKYLKGRDIQTILIDK